MDPEQTFLRVHARLSGMLSQLLTPRIRLALEYLYLAGAVALFCLLVVMHTNFVQQPGCSSEFSRIEFGEAQLVQIKIISGGLWASRGASYIMDLQNLGRSAEKILEVNGDRFNILASKFWSTWVGPGARRSVSDFKAAGEGSVHHPLSAKESFKAALTYLFRKWYHRVASFWRNMKQLSENALQLMVRSNWNDFLHIIKDLQLPSMDHLVSTVVQWFERRSKAFEPTYLYGVEKGYFLLSEGAKIRHGVRTINITISARNPCFGNRLMFSLLTVCKLLNAKNCSATGVLPSFHKWKLYMVFKRKTFGTFTMQAYLSKSIRQLSTLAGIL